MKKQLLKLAFTLLLATGLTTNTFAQWQNVGTERFSAGKAGYTSLAFSPSGEPYVAYDDEGNSNKATVMKFNGTSWIDVGTAGFSAGKADFTSLVFSPSGEPYVAYRDWTTPGNRASVMRFNGTDWVSVGTTGFSAGGVFTISLAFSPNGEPYVAYKDNFNFYKATVMKFNGTSWVDVGSTGFSAGQAEYTSIAFSPSGEPYVAYQDIQGGVIANHNATVMKFNGTSWVNVGAAKFSTGQASYTSLVFSPNGEPYVAYLDGGNSDKATVMKFDGTNWVNVGAAGFSAGSIHGISLAFNPNGEPYVAYKDHFNSNGEATVMKFDGTNWVNVGAAKFSAGSIRLGISLAFSPSGEPYVAYADGLNNSYKATVMKYVEETTGVNEIAQSNFTTVYPNPANSILHIEVKENTNIRIVNMLGSVVATQQLQTGNNTVDVSSLTNGIYFISNSTGGAVKFIKD